MCKICTYSFAKIFVDAICIFCILQFLPIFSVVAFFATAGKDGKSKMQKMYIENPALLIAESASR